MSLKCAQDFQESSFGSPNFNIGDLIRAIQRDTNISSIERMNLVQSVHQQTNYAPDSTPLKGLMYGAFGAVIGNLIAKYFGMGIVGRTLATVAGFGIGNAMNKQDTRSNLMPGWYGLS